MSESPNPLPYARQQPPSSGQLAMWTLISAALFLYVGFWLELVGVSGDPIYDGSVAAFVWMGRIVGIALLVLAVLTFANLPGVLPLNFVISVLATLGCAGVGAVWLMYSDYEGMLVLIFAALNGTSAHAAWQDWQAARRTSHAD